MGKFNAPISVVCPDLASEWRPSANGDVFPESVTVSSKFLAWWRCKIDPTHELQQSVVYRMRTKKCPYCTIAPKSLLALFPDVARQLHPTKNGDLNPNYMAPKTATRAWWQCDVNSKHVWDATVNSRTASKSGCPYCGGDKADETNSLASLYPQIAREWHPVKNGELRPDMVVTRSRLNGIQQKIAK